MTVYECLQVIRPALERLNNNGIDIKNIDNMVIYEEFITLQQKGEKKTYIMAFLGEKYSKSEKSIHRIIKRLEKKMI